MHNGETESRNQEKNVDWENRCQKAREKGVMCNSEIWDEADARVRSYLFLCLGMKGQRQVQQKGLGLNIQTTTTKITPFEAHMGRKANTPLSNITTNGSPNN